MLTILLWIVGVIGGLFVAYLAVMLVWTTVTGRRGRTPEGITATASAPSTCRVGEKFVIEVTITNALDKERVLSSTDLEKGLAAGFKVESVDPKPESVPTGPLLNMWVYSMKQVIPPSGTVVVRFHCRCVQAGEFNGNVAVYVDNRHFQWVECPLRLDAVDNDVDWMKSKLEGHLDAAARRNNG
ncbi:MAG: hypothetical protein H7210_00660 [Pyrinomonadaceae bacterium]|nr:hypothetical protein [Phycisphaerales bacterium]